MEQPGGERRHSPVYCDMPLRTAINTGLMHMNISQTNNPLACIMHEKWNSDRIVDRAKHNCDKWQNLT